MKYEEFPNQQFKANSLVVLLHGIGADALDLIPLAEYWSKNLKRRFYNGDNFYNIAHNKYKTYLFCKNLNIPTPKLYYHGKINNFDFLKLPSEYVIKPIDGYSSEGVFIMEKKYSGMSLIYFTLNQVSIPPVMPMFHIFILQAEK